MAAPRKTTAKKATPAAAAEKKKPPFAKLIEDSILNGKSISSDLRSQYSLKEMEEAYNEDISDDDDAPLPPIDDLEEFASKLEEFAPNDNKPKSSNTGLTQTVDLEAYGVNTSGLPSMEGQVFIDVLKYSPKGDLSVDEWLQRIQKMGDPYFFVARIDRNFSQITIAPSVRNVDMYLSSLAASTRSPSKTPLNWIKDLQPRVVRFADSIHRTTKYLTMVFYVTKDMFLYLVLRKQEAQVPLPPLPPVKKNSKKRTRIISGPSGDAEEESEEEEEDDNTGQEKKEEERKRRHEDTHYLYAYFTRYYSWSESTCHALLKPRKTTTTTHKH